MTNKEKKEYVAYLEDYYIRQYCNGMGSNLIGQLGLKWRLSMLKIALSYVISLIIFIVSEQKVIGNVLFKSYFSFGSWSVLLYR